MRCLYLANIQDDLYTTIKDQTGLDSMSLTDIQSLMLKKYNSTLAERREDSPRYNRQYLVSTDIDQDPVDSLTPVTLYKTTTGRPLSPVIPNKTPPSGRSSPSLHSNTAIDPYHIDKAEWMALSSSTKEKINLMRKHLRDQPSSSIKLLQTNDEQNVEPSNSSNETPPIEDNADPFGDTIHQFLVRAHRQFTVCTSRSRQPLMITAPFHILRQVVTPIYGRLISDSGADTGAISDTYAHIIAVHDAQVSVDGCHPSKTESYNLCDGIVAVDLCKTVYLLGVHGVPLIPHSIGLLLSEIQSRAHGIDIDSRPRSFGGKGEITIGDSIHIPLHLERGLMTCPIRKPTLDEINNLQVYWLMGDHTWDPSLYDEVPTSTTSIPQCYVSESTHHHIHISQSTLKLPDPKTLSRFLLYRPLDIIGLTPFSALLDLQHLLTTFVFVATSSLGSQFSIVHASKRLMLRILGLQVLVPLVVLHVLSYFMAQSLVSLSCTP